jgi:hypothetical protein
MLLCRLSRRSFFSGQKRKTAHSHSYVKVLFCRDEEKEQDLGIGPAHTFFNYLKRKNNNPFATMGAASFLLLGSTNNKFINITTPIMLVILCKF